MHSPCTQHRWELYPCYLSDPQGCSSLSPVTFPAPGTNSRKDKRAPWQKHTGPPHLELIQWAHKCARLSHSRTLLCALTGLSLPEQKWNQQGATAHTPLGQPACPGKEEIGRIQRCSCQWGSLAWTGPPQNSIKAVCGSRKPQQR